MEFPKIISDELITKQDERDVKELVVPISLTKIDDFPNHPYKVINDEKMQELCESIKEHGVNQPVILRKKNDGRYEMISGHRRKKASEMAGKKDIIAIVKELTDEEAIILMVDSNENQRKEILPSEKAFAYKMKMDAFKKRKSEILKNYNSSPMATNKNIAKQIGEKNGECKDNVYRYIRLTSLIPEILTIVDEKKIAFRPAVEISYLSKKNQKNLLDIMKCYEATPSLSQAKELKELEKKKELTLDKIEEIMSKEKANQIPKYEIDYKKFERYLPRNVVTIKEVENYLLKCAEEYYKVQNKQREKNEIEKERLCIEKEER